MEVLMHTEIADPSLFDPRVARQRELRLLAWELAGESGCVLTLAVLPDGRLASAGTDQAVRVWDLDAGQQALCLRHGQRVLSLAVLSDGSLASAAFDNSIRIWDTQTGQNLLNSQPRTLSVWATA